MTDTNTPERRLYTLAALMTKAAPNGATSLATHMAYRIASDGEDAVIGRYVQKLLADNPNWRLTGKVGVMEITREDLRQMEPTDAE